MRHRLSTPLSTPPHIHPRTLLLTLSLAALLTSCTHAPSVTTTTRATAPTTKSSSPAEVPLEAARAVPSSLAILQGATSRDSTQLAVLFKKGSDHLFVLRREPDGDVVFAHSERTLSREHSAWAIRRLTYTHLDPEHIYRLEIIDEKGSLVDARWLRTLETTEPQLTMLSTTGKALRTVSGEELQKIQDTHHPDLALVFGTGVPSDLKSPESLWAHLAENLNKAEFFRIKDLIPTLIVRDAADSAWKNAKNRSGMTEDYLEVFNAFVPYEAASDSLERGPGSSFVFRAFGQTLLITDDFGLREPRMTPSTRQSLWSATQERWILERLAESTVPTWLIGAEPNYEAQFPKSYRGWIENLKLTHVPLVFANALPASKETAPLIAPFKGLDFNTWQIRQMDAITLIRSEAEKDKLDLEISTINGPAAANPAQKFQIYRPK